MQINVLEYAENAAKLWPERIVYRDSQDTITFLDALNESHRVGSMLCRVLQPRRSVIVLAEKSVHVASLYLGAAAAGCFYVPLDSELPAYRLKIIFDIVQPEAVLLYKTILPCELNFSGKIITFEECLMCEPDLKVLAERRGSSLDTDPLYVIFTSGSSGVPKGIVASHRNVIDYIDAFAEVFGICESDVFGNQSPLDYIAALRDLYLPLKTGAETVLIPKSLFSIPLKLFEYINQNNVTVICWVAAALSLCSELGVFKQIIPDKVSKVFFTGSVLSGKHLRIWQEHLPNVMFVNHYGPTEITASCTYYIVDHKVTDNETIPIGIPFKNSGILLLNENGMPTPEGEIGEIYVQGAGVALGYFGDPEKTQQFFITNPLNPYYSEIIYKTGDLGSLLPDGNFAFHGRKDFQIKHMGHRIELGEIEAAALSVEGINDVCCLYKLEKEMIYLFFTGESDKKELAIHLRNRLPGFMVPRKFIKLNEMPKLPNGKTNIGELKGMMG